MKITLRKANAIQESIQDHIKSIDVAVTVTLNEFQSSADVVAARTKLLANDDRRTDLLTALYTIRDLVGIANATSGVSSLLARTASIDKKLAQLKGFIESTAAEDDDIIDKKLEKIRLNDKSESRLYGYSNSITTGILTQAQIDEFKTEMLTMKKIKQSLNDQILELNIKTDIELSDQIVQTLQSEQLI
jgi:hypothetical protein